MSPKTIEIPANFDSANTLDFRDRIGDADGSVIIDFHNTQFIDSSGIGTLVFWLRTLQAVKGRMIFANLSGQPADLVALVGLDKHVEILETRLM